MLYSESKQVRQSAALAPGKIGPEAKPAVPALIIALEDRDMDVRIYAAKALRKIGGTAAKQAILVLIQSLKDENKDIRQLAAEALGEIGHEAEPAVPALIQALDDAYKDVRRCAAVALGQIGSQEKNSNVYPRLVVFKIKQGP